MSDSLELAKQIVADRERAKRDKLYLANEVLGFDFVWETHAELFACYIKYDERKTWVEQDSNKDRMVLWSRGHYKTTSIVVEIIQAIINFPDIRILIMQGSLGTTKTLLKQILAHFTGEASESRFKELFPEFCGNKKVLQATTMQFTTTARIRKQIPQPTVAVASDKSVKTGQHYDVGFFDDLVNDQNYRNPRLQEKVKESFDGAQPLIDPGCYRFVTGTRYAFGDLYEQILRRNAKDANWVVSVKTCWTDDSAGKPDSIKTPRFPRFTKRGGQLGGFTREELLRIQSDNPAHFACQYLNQPIHSSQQAFTKELIESTLIGSSETPVLSDPILVVDLASSTNITSDDSVITVGRVDPLGVGYLADMRGGQWAPIDLAMNIIDMALKYRPTRIMFEKTASCVYFADFLKLVAKQKGIYLPLDFIKVDNRDDAKNVRVLGLAGIMARKRFRILKGVPKLDKLIEQACEFPKGRNGHDDYIDTAALLYQELSKQILALPLRTVPTNNILALIQDRENSLQKVLTELELREVEHPDLTGLD
jgi:Terminase RNaseH-like domain